jgi:hypothetical protein
MTPEQKRIASAIHWMGSKVRAMPYVYQEYPK